MSEHIGENELKNYGENNLSLREFLRVQAHLETCEDCARRLDDMFPNIVEREETLLLEDLSREILNDFHLDYEEHLKPFIYGTIDAVDKEIVESHVEICHICRDDLRDLLQFHEELKREREIRELSKPRFWMQFAGWFSAPNRKTVWLAFAIVLVFIGAGLGWLLWSKPQEVAENPARSSEPLPDQIVPPPDEQKVVSQNAAAPSMNLANSPKQNRIETVKETELANLVLPKFLNELRTNDDETRRGSDDSETRKIAVVSPNSAVIRDTSPVLTWKVMPELQNYEVAVFDEDFNRLAKIEAVGGNSWRVSNLPKGKIYQWQVAGNSISADGKPTKYLGQGKFYIVSQESENRIDQAKNRLDRGKALAEAGLLREAAAEFRLYLNENPTSENARKFLRQIGQVWR